MSEPTKPDAVLAHCDRQGTTPTDPVGLRKIQDEAVALMGLPVTHPPGVIMSTEAGGWRFIRTRTPDGHSEAELTFPADHVLRSQSRYEWTQVAPTLMTGTLRSEARDAFDADVAARQAGPALPHGIVVAIPHGA